MDKDDVGARLDLEAKKVLKCLDEHGECSITEIKTRIGEKKHVVSYRMDKLEDLGLINVDKRERKDNVGTIRWSSLSSEGRTLIQQGLLAELEKEKEAQKPMFDDNKMEEIESRIENMENRLNTMIDDISKMNTKERQVKEMEESVSEIETDLEELRKEFKETRNWLDKWTETQEKNMQALKTMVNEEFDKDLEEYT